MDHNQAKDSRKGEVLSQPNRSGGGMQDSRIKCYIAAGEGERAKKLALAIAEDPRFESLEVNAEIPVDVQFLIELECNEPFCIDGHDADYQKCLRCSGSGKINKIFNCEFKECSDYIQSALGKEGHLFMQHLAMRESGHAAMVLVLGGDDEVSAAIRSSLVTRYRRQELAYQIANYEARLQDFEAQSFAMGIPVMRWKARPFSRLLSHAAKVLLDGNLMEYRPRPADGERELVSCCCLTRGIGPETWRNVLAEYQLQLLPRKDPAKPIEEIAGVGPKRAEAIGKMIRMVYK